MKVSCTEAKSRLAALIRVMESGDEVVITRHGKPVAQIVPPPRESRKVILGSMKGRIQFLPGWDQPISEGELFGRGHKRL